MQKLNFSPPSLTLIAPYHPASSYNSHSAVPKRHHQFNQNLERQKTTRRTAYLLANPLPTILAFDRMLDNRIARRPSVDKRNGIQRDTNTDEVEDFVDERTRRGGPDSLAHSQQTLLPFSNDQHRSELKEEKVRKKQHTPTP